MATLLLSFRYTEDDQALWRAAIGRKWSVERVRGLRVPDIDDPEIVLYLEGLFAPTIAEALGLRLLEPPEDWLVALPMEFRKREVRLTRVGEARGLAVPAFIKPPNDKSFKALVYQSGAELPDDLSDETPVLVAEPVAWESEFRCFCLDGRVKTVSPYVRSGVLARHSDFAATDAEREAASRFAAAALAASNAETPRAVVVDVGTIEGRGWAVVEANGAWGSGIYGCDPDAVLDVIRCATVRAE